MPVSPSRTPRFFVDTVLGPGIQLTLPADAGRHASRVLRMREGDAIVLFNGAGGEYSGHIVGLSRDAVCVEIRSHVPTERESPLDVTLAQGISAGDRMDLTIQKAVELGVAAIQPLLAERSVVRLKGERLDSRREHWQRIAASACEQSGRNRVPPVDAATEISNFKAPSGALRLLLAPAASATLRSLALGGGQSIVLAAGPEAGFSPREEALLVAKGFMPVRLGPRILRTETAGPAALAALNALYGDG